MPLEFHHLNACLLQYSHVTHSPRRLLRVDVVLITARRLPRTVCPTRLQSTMYPLSRLVKGIVEEKESRVS